MHEDDDYFNNNKKTSQNAANDYCARSRFLVCSDCREFQTTKMNGVPRNLVSKSFLQQDDINYRLVIDFIPAELIDYQRRLILTEYYKFTGLHTKEWLSQDTEDIPGLFPHHLDPGAITIRTTPSSGSGGKRMRNSSARSPDEARWVCPTCGKRYKYSRGLAMHRRLECGKEPMFHCPFCPQKCHQKVTGDEMATITATQRVVNNHLTNFNYHHLSSVIKYLNNQQQTPQQPQQPKTWTTTNALSISQRYFEKIAPASVGIPALMNQNFYDMQDSGSDASGHDGYGRHRRHNRDKEPIFQCPDCDKRYRSKTSLSLHKRLECGKEPAFQCPYCPLKTHQKGNLQVHIKKKHNDHGELNRTY